MWETDFVSWSLAPSVSLGTHENNVGVWLHLAFHWEDLLPPVDCVFHWLDLSYKFSSRPLGIPRPTHVLFGAFGIGGTWGKRHHLPLPFIVGRRSHSLMYQWEGYADTQQTGQWSGAIAYVYAQEAFAIRFAFEDDFMSFLGKDEFRTGALELSVWVRASFGVWGIGLKSVIWTGTTSGLTNLDRGQYYDMKGQWGSDYSHGVLALSVYLNGCFVSIGWDAESIRDVVQNRFHDLIDDGRIPLLKRNERVYIQFGCKPQQNLY